MLLRRIAVTMIVFAGTACSGGDRGGADAGESGGTLIIAAPAEPRLLLPPLVNNTSEKQIADQIFDGLADIGPDLNTIGDHGWTPRLASSWTWSADSLSIAFRLNPRAVWHDGRPVRAGDVRFTIDLYKDPKTAAFGARGVADVDSASVADSLTAVVWFRRRSPEQFYAVAYNVQILPEHLLRDADRATLATSEFARHPIGSGPFRFVRWESRSVIELSADTASYLGRPRLDRVIWNIIPEPTAAIQSVVNGASDFYEALLLPEALALAANTPTVRTLPYRTLNYGYLAFNFRDPKNADRPHPLFADRALRTALSMALDRGAMLANVFGELGVLALGPFSRGYATADTTIPQIGYDTARAARMLDSLGWRDRDGDGVRERNGVPLRFSLLSPSVSAPRHRYTVLLQEQWRRIGVRVDIEETEFPVFVPRIREGRFDVMLNAWQTNPSPSGVRDDWGTSALPDRASNFGAFSSPRVDATLDSALLARHAASVRELYHRGYRAITEEVPAVWLYESRPRAAVHARVRATLDQTDAWWRDLRHWWIPSAERMPRDRIGVSPQNPK
jgi:peptide/nickel transport system substrate-binding protein